MAAEEFYMFSRKGCYFWNYCSYNWCGWTFQKISKCLPCCNCYIHLNNRDGVGLRENPSNNSTLEYFQILKRNYLEQTSKNRRRSAIKNKEKRDS